MTATVIKLGKDTFMVPQPPGMRSFALQQRIIPVAGRVLNTLIHAIGKEDVEGFAEKDVASVLPAVIPYLGQVFSEMKPGELEAIARELLRDATCNKLPLFTATDGDAFDGLLQGRTVDTWKLLWHALKVWYPDFFQLAGPLFGGTGAKASQSKESKDSPTSGRAGEL